MARPVISDRLESKLQIINIQITKVTCIFKNGKVKSLKTQ